MTPELVNVITMHYKGAFLFLCSCLNHVENLAEMFWAKIKLQLSQCICRSVSI